MAFTTTELKLNSSPQSVVKTLAEVRRQTLDLVNQLPAEVVEKVHSELMSPIVWDLGHIASFEDLWLVHKFGEQSMLRPDLAEVYDAFETPRANRGELPFLCLDDCLDYLAKVRKRTLEIVDHKGVGDGFLFEMIVRHELQHNETIIQTLQIGQVAVKSFIEANLGNREIKAAVKSVDAVEKGGIALVEIPTDIYSIGAELNCFSYDNERPKHERELDGFLIGQTAVTNRQYADFIECGGYQRPELWSSEGWRWLIENDVERPLYWTAGGEQLFMGSKRKLSPSAPVAHISWFEAEAFANMHGLRLPTEFEWEAAAKLGSISTSDTWEWTASQFSRYPGFTAHPYREYSEVFFDSGYFVLRGGSWATAARAVTPTFRNWDLPQRRQIFSGFRVAQDLDLKMTEIR